MGGPTEEQLLLLNTIIYTGDFANQQILDEGFSVLEWANDFDLASINNAHKPAEISRDEFATVIQEIKNKPEIYDKMIIKNIENAQYANQSGSQRVTNAVILYEEDLIFLYKGTAGDMEWRDNGEGGYSSIADTGQQRAALVYFDEMKKLFAEEAKGNIYVTGHSKGGNKAQYVSILRGAEITQCYSFDGQGFGQAFLLKYQKLIEQNQHKITSISNAYDFVNILLFPLAGERRYIKSKTSWGIADGSSFAKKGKGAEAQKAGSVIENISPTDALNRVKAIGSQALTHKIGAWHSPYSMFTTNEEGELVLNAEVKQSELMQNTQALFTHFGKFMSEEDWRYLCFNLMSMMQSGKIHYGDDYSEKTVGFEWRLSSLVKDFFQAQKGVNGQDAFLFIHSFFGFTFPGFLLGAGFGGVYDFSLGTAYSNHIRDFSEGTKEQLLLLVEEVENEPFWNLTKWDIFYKVDKYLLGGVDFPGNSQDFEQYYRKIIDMQEISRIEIQRIFQDVYATEAEYTKRLKEQLDEGELLLSQLSNLTEKIR